MSTLNVSSGWYSGFPWESLDAGSIIVDVGGGVGMVSVEIAKKFPDLKFIVQDLPDVTNQAREVRRWFDLSLSRFIDFRDNQFWNEQLPGSVESGMVAIQGLCLLLYIIQVISPFT
jgi:O-methyltransferase domain